MTSLGAENLNAPAGTMRVGDQEPNVRFTALAQSVDDIKNIVINRGGAAPPGRPCRPSTCATWPTWWTPTQTPPASSASTARNSIGLTVTKQPDANSIKVADDVKATIDRVGRTVPQGITFKVANDTTRYTRDALHDVQFDLTLAVFITATVLLLFLHSWRNTLIVLLAIPISLISTFMVMYFLGFSLNLMSLMALALLIGILVDDSIVVLENIHRHLALGETPWTAALKGRSEIGLAAIAITLLDVVVYVPVAFMSGNIGTLFRQFGLTIAAATLFSLFVSFTLTPLLASRWLKAHGEGGGDEAKVAGVTGALIAVAAGIVIGLHFFTAPLEGQTVPVPGWITATWAWISATLTGAAATAGAPASPGGGRGRAPPLRPGRPGSGPGPGPPGLVDPGAPGTPGDAGLPQGLGGRLRAPSPGATRASCPAC